MVFVSQLVQTSPHLLTRVAYYQMMSRNEESRDCCNSIQRKRDNLSRSIRKEQIDSYFQSRRQHMQGVGRSQLQIQQLHAQIKTDPLFFKDCNQVMGHIPTIIGALNQDLGDRATNHALTCLTLVLRQNKELYYLKMVKTETNIYHILRRLMQEGTSRTKIKVLNIFNWLASEYSDPALPRLWAMDILEDLNALIQQSFATATYYQIVINLVANLVGSHKTCWRVVEHAIFEKIVALLRHPDEKVQAESFSCVQQISRHLDPNELTPFLKKHKIVPVLCFRISYLHYSGLHIARDALLTLQRYIAANMSQQSDFNAAVHELQNVYNLEGVLQTITTNVSSSAGELVLELCELAEEILDTMAECVNGDTL